LWNVIASRSPSISGAAAKRYQSLKVKAEIDQLSGFYNKMTSELAIQDFLSNEGKEGRHALCILDLDDFKRINDELGHLAGDKAITELSDRINCCLRSTDIKGRIGGDEFILLLKNIKSYWNLVQKADEICSRIKEIRLEDNPHWKVCASIGIALYPDHADNYTDLFQKADKAMYFSKELGKGAYYIYTGDTKIDIKDYN
jgi:diguanylate cyclase (GGDEF)-like protein